MSETVGLVVIGGGQAGLAVSHELTKLDVEHVVLEKGRIGQTWRDRWASFCLVTPNWSVQLPGHPYDGDDPDGFMPKDEIVAYLERYTDRFGAPIREGVEVRSLAEALIRTSCSRRRQARFRLAPSSSAPAPINARIARRALPPYSPMYSPLMSRVTAAP